MTTVMLRLCVKGGFLRIILTTKIIVFWKESEQKDEGVWDDCTFSVPGNLVLGLFDLSHLRSL